jgi:hypothetical protein
MLLGIALMVYPYFISDDKIMLVIGIFGSTALFFAALVMFGRLQLGPGSAEMLKRPAHVRLISLHRDEVQRQSDGQRND